ncbi:MAG: dimethylsulfonioproprionate lyase family protein [Nitratireductor sp.]
MSVKNLFHAFHDYLSMRSGEPVDAFLQDADWNVTERSATPNVGVELNLLNAAQTHCGSGERYLVKTLIECAPSLVWHKRQIAEKQVSFVEIIGPRGHFPSSSIAGGIMFLDAGAQLEDYYFSAEELLIPLNEGAEFSMDSKAFSAQKSGTILFHESNERRAIKTNDTPLLVAYVLRDGDLQEQAQT